MQDSTIKRLSRLTAILTQLQSKRIVTATSLANKYGVNVRTIYRDIKALEESGVPIYTEEGKGYAIAEGYRIPPVMFTEREALALVTAGQVIAAQKDSSFRNEFSNAITKIKSVLRNHNKDKTEMMEAHIYVGKNVGRETTSHAMMDIQTAITSHQIIHLQYKTEDHAISNRLIEPYMLYHGDKENWVLIAWCRLRNGFRSFRLDRIDRYSILQQTFTSNKKRFNEFIRKNFLG